MADARALLQQQRASRRITHPLARYTDSNKLLCTICDTLIKSESSWAAHLKTPDHAKRVLRAAEAQQKQQSASRKRKADSEPVEDNALPAGGAAASIVAGGGVGGNTLDASADIDARKRVDVDGARSRDDTPANASSRASSSVPSALAAAAHAIPAAHEMAAHPHPRPSPASTSTTTQQQPQTIPQIRLEEDADWLELQTLLDDGNGTSSKDTSRHQHATMSAPAMTTAEIAAREAGEEMSSGAGGGAKGSRREREEEEEEREDAAARLEEEVEEMGGLEERVRRLKERREELRAVVGQRAGAGRAGVLDGGTLVDDGGGGAGGADGVETNEDEDEDDEDDVWNFGAD